MLENQEVGPDSKLDKTESVSNSDLSTKLKNWTRTALNRLINRLQNVRTKLTESQSLKTEPYLSLTPISDADKEGHYCDALKWALENSKSKNIHNIAVTGPYGSGKSSVIKTFEKRYRENSPFLYVSLATFEEEGTTNNEDTSQLNKIELSILQQIFYHEKDKLLPDSRLKKITKQGPWKRVFQALFLFLFFVTGYLVLFQKKYYLSDIGLKNKLDDTPILGLAFLVFFGYLIFRLIRPLNLLKINKLSFQNAEIGLDSKDYKSILNYHLDEILYFFETRPYDVIIFEDLDRFKNTAIFTKLREINWLLNNSKKIKRQIVFIYAVRNDKFQNKERIKFFDFILPIIPTINYSNSQDFLFNQNEVAKYDLSKEFIEDISFVVDELRLLYNICNEYVIYRNLLKGNLVPEKLFAVITYKNIDPKDFSLLSRSDGFLVRIMNKKQQLISQQLQSIDEKFENLQAELSELKKNKLESVKELRRLYLSYIIEDLSNFNGFYVNNQLLSMDEASEDSNFQYFINGNAQYKNQNRYVALSTSIGAIDSKLEPQMSYKERESKLLNIQSGRIEELEAEIRSIDDEKRTARNLKIKDVITSQIIEESVGNHEVEDYLKRWLNIVIKKGYISEDYVNYVSIFHEGSISKQDHDFYTSLKSNVGLDFDYSLDKEDNLIEKLNLNDFSSVGVLNIQLIDRLLDEENKEKYDTEIRNFFSYLAKASKPSILFIREYVLIARNAARFVNLLFAHHLSIWVKINASAHISSEEKRSIFAFILKELEIKHLMQLLESKVGRNLVLKDKLFFTLFKNDERYIEILENVELEFTDLSFKDTPKAILIHIYSNDCYELSEVFISKIIKEFGRHQEVTFTTKNYSAILDSECAELIRYVNQNINTYLRQVYLNIDSNTEESESSLVKLLGNDEIERELVEEVIIKVNTRLSTLNSIPNKDVLKLIVTYNKAQANWANVFEIFSRLDEDSEEHSFMAEFIDNSENATELAKNKLPSKVNGENIYGEMWKLILENENISDDNYTTLIKSNPWWYDSLTIDDLSNVKVEALIKQRVFKPTKNSLNKIRLKSHELSGCFIAENKSEIEELLEDVVLSEDELGYIIDSDKLSSQEKFRLTERSEFDEILESNDYIAITLSEMIISNPGLNIHDDIVQKLLQLNSVESFKRVNLYNLKANKSDRVLLQDLLSTLESPYSDLLLKNKRPKLKINKVNEDFLSQLVVQDLISSFKVTKGYYMVFPKRQ